MRDVHEKLTLDTTMHEIAKFHFVLAEGRKGNHLLFDAETIRGTFTRQSEELTALLQTRIEEVNAALNQTFALATFEEKRKYIGSLAQDLQHAMIFGYFQILDGLENQSGERSVH